MPIIDSFTRDTIKGEEYGKEVSLGRLGTT